MIIALSGIAGVGKDSIGEAVQKRLNAVRLSHRTPPFEKGYSIKKFAGVTNEVFTIITGKNYSKTSGEEKEFLRPRFSQFAETMKDIFGLNIWAKGLLNKRTEKSNNWIITDLRFAEELQELNLLDNNEEIFLFRIRRECEECGLIEAHEESCSKQNVLAKEIKMASYYGWDGIIINDTTVEIAADKIVEYILTYYKIEHE